MNFWIKVRNRAYRYSQKCFTKDYEGNITKEKRIIAQSSYFDGFVAGVKFMENNKERLIKKGEK